MALDISRRLRERNFAPEMGLVIDLKLRLNNFQCVSAAVFISCWVEVGSSGASGCGAAPGPPHVVLSILTVFIDISLK